MRPTLGTARLRFDRPCGRAQSRNAMTTISIADLLKYTSGYVLGTSAGKRTITVPFASKLADVTMVQVTGGKLLPKQGVTYNLSSGKRTVKGVSGGKYQITANDGDLHFCVGTSGGKPHIPCEIQAADGQQNTYNSRIGKACDVTGFFRCLFEHPGFRSNDDAHIFELHPVRSVNLGGWQLDYELLAPDNPHPWGSSLNNPKTTVVYRKAQDQLTFTDANAMDTNYVTLKGRIGGFADIANTGQAHARLTSSALGTDGKIKMVFLKGTQAYSDARGKNNGAIVNVLGLRNIDLQAALQNRYEINLLMISVA